jgi:hypothetical protein
MFVPQKERSQSNTLSLALADYAPMSACPRAVGFQRRPMSIKSDCPGDGLFPGSRISTTSVKSDCPGDLQPNVHANWNLGTYRFSAMDPHISRALGMPLGILGGCRGVG